MTSQPSHIHKKNNVFSESDIKIPCLFISIKLISHVSCISGLISPHSITNKVVFFFVCFVFKYFAFLSCPPNFFVPGISPSVVHPRSPGRWSISWLQSLEPLKPTVAWVSGGRGTTGCVDMTGSHITESKRPKITPSPDGVNNIHYGGSKSSYNIIYIPCSSLPKLFFISLTLPTVLFPTASCLQDSETHTHGSNKRDKVGQHWGRRLLKYH